MFRGNIQGKYLPRASGLCTLGWGSESRPNSTHQPSKIREDGSDSRVDGWIVGVIAIVTQTVSQTNRSGVDDHHEDKIRKLAHDASDHETDENIVEPDGAKDALCRDEEARYCGSCT